MRLTFLGTGTSHGIPVIACDCKVCSSNDPKNNRLRSSLLIEDEDRSILIDTTPEFRMQAIKYSIKSVDALLYTHPHADHLHGIDDVRPLSVKKHIPVYALEPHIKEIEERFPYIFKETPQKGGGKPNLYTVNLTNSIKIGNLNITPIPIKHGIIDIFGYRINNVAYLTDCSFIPEESYKLLENLDILIIGALRYREHKTHFNIDQAINEIEKINPKRAYFTHICHDIDHKTLCIELDEMSKKRSFIKKIKPAHDGLILKSD